MNVASIKGELTLDSSGYKKGIDQAKQATGQFLTVERQADASCAKFMKTLEEEANVLKRTGDALKQETGFVKELTAAQGRLTAIREGESKAAQDVISRYYQLTVAEQKELIAAKEALSAHAAKTKALADEATAAERAAAREIAASERAAAREIAAQERAAAAAERAAQRRLSAARIGQGLASAGRSLSFGVTAPILGLAAAGTKLFGDMEENLNVLQQISGATGDQMKALSAQAIALGGDMKLPATSAADAARAMIELKQAGLSVDEVMKAVRPTLVLTAATGLDVADSARLAASTMNAFALPPARLTHVMDMLVAAQSAAGVKMKEITPAIRQASAQFRTSGQSVESLVTALAVLSKAGVRGELAGTGLRNMLVNLSKETPKVTAAMKALGVQAFDPITKQMKPLRTLIDEMSRSLERFTPQARQNLLNTIFGGRSQGANVLFRGVEQFDQMAAAIEKEGAAAAAAEARNKGLKGAMDALRSAFETALIQGITPIKDDLNVFARRIGEVAKAFADLPAPVRKNIVELLALSAVLGPALLLVGRLVQGFAAMKLALEAASTAGILAKAAIGGPWIALAVAAIAALALAWKTDFGGMRTAITEFGKEFSEWWKGTVSPILQMFSEGAASIGHNFVLRFNAMRDAANDLTAALGRTAAGRAVVDAAKTAGQAQMGALGPVSGIGAFVNMFQRRAAERAQREQFRGLADYQDVPPGAFAAIPKPAGPPRPAGTTAKAGTETYDPSKAGRKPKLTAEQKEGIRFAEELAQAQARLSAVLAGEDNIAAQVAARYHLLSAARRADLVHVLEQIKRAQDEKKAHEEVVAAIDNARLALLKSQAAAGAGEYSRQTVALDLFKKSWSDLSKEQQGATDKVLKWKIEQKGIDQGKAQIDALQKGLGDLQLQYEGLTAATEIQRFAATDLHRHWGTLTEDEKILAAQSLQMKLNIDAKNAADKAALAVIEKQKDAFQSLQGLYAEQVAKNMELKGATDQQVDAFKLLQKQLDQNDPAVKKLIADYLAIVGANEALSRSNKEAAQAAAASQKIDELLANTLADLNAEYDTLTGAQPEQTRAINRLARAHKDLTIVQRLQLEQIQKGFKQRELLRGVRQFADGFEGIFQNAFEGLSQGFKGFFSSIYQGFKQLLIRMAAEYLASQLKQVVLKGLASLVGAAFGGGGGGTATSGSGTGGLFPTAALGGAAIQGRPMLVGERGSELFVPPSSGRIIPNNQLAGAGGNSTVNIHLHGITDYASFKRNEGQMIGTMSREAERQRRRNGNG